MAVKSTEIHLFVIFEVKFLYKQVLIFFNKLKIHK